MTAQSRRQNLLTHMDQLEGQGFTCQGCKGTCCTFEANSMMVTPLEAFELLSHLKKSALHNPELKTKIEATISQYRLDHQMGNGKRSYLRRTYTCPFFNHTELGCPLPREVKPYGCLAFNSHHKENKAGAECFSESDVLMKREEIDLSENSRNAFLRNKHSLIWEKSPLPTALIDIWDKEFSDADPELN
jgi:Fe-S-cluster containining protein